MSDRRKKNAVASRTVAYIAAAVLHLLIIGVLVSNFTNTNNAESVEAFDADKIDIVKARAVDEDLLNQTRDEIKRKDQAKRKKRELEEQQLRDLQDKAEQEKKRLAELEKQKAAAEEAERKRVIAIEKKKKEDELKEKKRKEQEEREAEEKRKELAKLAKEKAKREAEIKRIKEEQALLEQARRAREQEELTKRLEQEEIERSAAAVQRAAAQRTATVESKYSALIKKAVRGKRVVPPGTEPWRKVRLNIKLSPLGEVVDVRVVESSGSQVYDQSAETAVLQASPLPLPTEEEDQSAHLKMQDVTFTLTP